jgi:diguanylate cyclase (GGDEF)-like protein
MNPVRTEPEAGGLLRQAMKLMGVATDLAALLEPGEVPAQVVAHLSEGLDFKAVSVLLLDSQTRELQYAADFGVPPAVKAMGFRPDGTTWQVMERGTPVFIENMAIDQAVNASARPYFRSYACLPIAYQERRLGVLIVNYGETHHFGEVERQVLRAFASATAVALEKVRLLERLRQNSERLATLARLGTVFSESMELPHALEVLDRSIREQLPGIELSLCWIRDRQGRLEAGFSRGLEILGLTEAEATLGAERFLEGWVPSSDPVPLPQEQVLGALPAGRLLLPLALRAGAQLEGLLLLRAEAASPSFQALDLDFLQALSDRAGLAIHQAKRYRASQDAATLDSMTGVLNHGSFITQAVDQILDTRRADLDLSLLMLDVDHFKNCNDTHGHLFGDTVLMALAQEIRTHLRPTDLVGRWGGEEFVILLPGVGFDLARAIAERIRQAIEHMDLPTAAGERVQVPTISMGMSSLGEAIHTLPELVHTADQALYRAKTGGRNQVRW